MHYSQVKYQVVVALFRDAVVEPHCSRDRRVMGYTWLPPHSLGMPLLPFGHEQELGKGTAGLFLLLLPLAGQGILLTRGPQPWPQPGAVMQSSKITSKLESARGCAWPGFQAAAGLSWALGRLQAWVSPAPSGEVPKQRESSAGS